eukprot:10038624-Ditylum_brightwellii.AAC.1
MGCDEGSVALLKQGSENSNTLHEPGLVAFWVSKEEGLFRLNDGGGKVRCFTNVLLELPSRLFLLKEAAVDKRSATVLLSEKGVSRTQ